jgi:hypothetical protein
MKYVYLLETKGTIPKVRPQAAWQNKENNSNTTIDPARELVLPRITQNMPPRI